MEWSWLLIQKMLYINNKQYRGWMEWSWLLIQKMLYI